MKTMKLGKCTCVEADNSKADELTDFVKDYFHVGDMYSCGICNYENEVMGGDIFKCENCMTLNRIKKETNKR